ncbi:peptidoglycan-binding protein [Reyranella sp.]|jgi:peptidoglycan hydrolase-like protein with peptidoglycan-binding domain|uniref:peptidoglycan-binding protein n=1 Tax=Reyranella sp. TaxID=1929291 RepID=UPI002F940049
MPLSDDLSMPGASPSGDDGHPQPEPAMVHAVAEAECAPLSPGETVGRYEIVALLGQGSLGPSYRGRDRELGREVMIKEFLPPALATRSAGARMTPRSPELAADLDRARERFIEEARNLSTLQGAPFLARVVDLVDANDTFYVVLDLVAGISLEDRLHGGKCLRPGEVDRLLRALLEALLQLHDAGLLHGDINPANIMLDMSGRPTLVNVGGARLASAVRMPALAALSRAEYAAPEQVDDDTPGPWTDIYSLAATFHCAIAGHPPPGPAARAHSDSYRRLTTLAPSGFAPALLAGIDRGLELAHDDRPQSVAEWQAMLWPASGPRAVMAALPSQVGVLPPEPRRVSSGRRPAFWIAAAAAVSIGVAAAGGFHELGGTQLLLDAFSPPPKSVRPAGTDERTRLALEHTEAMAHQAALDEIRRNRAAERAALDAVEAEMRQQEAARKQAEADATAAALRRRQEEEQAILKKLEAEAEAKRQADAAAEAKRRADTEAEAKRLAEAEAKQQADTLDLKAAEARESALRLSRLDRQHVQVALNALGFDVGNLDGSFSTQMRRTIADWQRRHKEPPTGFLTSAQIETMLRDAPQEAIADFDALQDPRRAEANEVALRLSPLDRQHVQVALASLGFDPGDIDSIFGPRTRQMIATWQITRNDAPTGFLTSIQLQALAKDGAAAIATYDDTLEPTRAEAREVALNLSPLDRQRLQVALTAQGFDTLGTDSRFGPRTRQMIAAWQKAHDEPASGFLTQRQVRTLLDEAAAALARFDSARKTATAKGRDDGPPADASLAQPDTTR